MARAGFRHSGIDAHLLDAVVTDQECGSGLLRTRMVGSRSVQPDSILLRAIDHG
jgi:hypothetical protein